MRSSIVALSIAVLVVVSATALFSGARVDDAPVAAGALDKTSFDAEVVSFDGTSIAITVYRPAGASAESPVPVVLHSHGWSGSRIKDGTDIVGRLWNESLGVVTIDARGHGDSGGFAMVHHKDWEVKDFQAILDWIYDNLDWVQKEPASGIPNDVVAGAAGYSYGGGFQLMTASYDKRLDALTPQITWGDLPYALAPNGQAKSVWIDFLYGTAIESGTRYDPRIDDWYRQILATNEVPQEALDHFAGSSPIMSEIDADVLLIQGVPDVLFNLNQAIHNYQALEAAGAGDIRLFTHLTGHVLPGVQPFQTTPERYNVFIDTGPCGLISDQVSAFLHEKLEGGPASGIPEVSFALDTGECIELDELPTSTQEYTAALALAPIAAGSTLVPLAEGPLVLGGIPHLVATADAVGASGTVFASLVVGGADGFRVVDDQTTPIPVTPGATIDIDLVGVATQIGEGEQLLLRLDGLNEWYFHNSGRVPGGVLLHDITVTAPFVE